MPADDLRRDSDPTGRVPGGAAGWGRGTGSWSAVLGAVLTPLLLAAAPAGAAPAVPILRASSPGPASGRALPSAAKSSVQADTLSTDSLRALIERAGHLADAGRHAAAGGLLESAARGRPDIADWLRLSALQQSARAGLPAWARSLAAGLRDDPVVPRDSVDLELVRADLVAADSAPAASVAAVAGSMDARWDPDLWTRLAGPVLLAAGDTAAAMAGYRRALDADGVPKAAGEALLALDDGWRTLNQVAEAERREGRDENAARLLARAVRAAPAARGPELALELARTRLEAGLSGVRSAVLPWLRRRDTPDSVRSAMELAVGTEELRRGRRGPGEAALRRAAVGRGTAAARSAYLLADLAHDRGKRATMRTWLERASRRFPHSSYGGIALMRLGFAAFLAGRFDDAARRFRSYRVRSPRGEWTSASLYWEGRAREDGGDTATSTTLYRRVASSDPVGYYGLRAERRLGDGGLVGVRADTLPEPPAEWDRRADSLLARMDLLRELGWRDRALAELDAARTSLVRREDERLALARRLEKGDWSSPAIGMAWSAFATRSGRWDLTLLKAIYPLPYRDTLVAAARRAHVDPALLAAIVRQESAFDPRAVSSAGAIGLTQLMPATARRVARQAGLPVPDSADLLDPDLNIELGAHYLADLLRRYDGSSLAALVAYNAGPSRWRRWRALPEHRADQELFVESIPYAETRRYVKAVLRNELLYRKLHDLGAPSRAAETGAAAADSALGSG